MIRAVFDTNILISSIFWRGPPYNLMHKTIAGDFLLFTSVPIINEMRRVLTSDFEMPMEKMEEQVDIIISNSVVVEPIEKLDVIKADESDNRILECALAGGVDYIVSGDKHLLQLKEYGEIEIVTAAKMVEILER